MIKLYNIVVFHISGSTNVLGHRCMGSFRDREESANSIIDNKGDIHECLYDYAIVEEVTANTTFPMSKIVDAFKWNDQKWKLISVKKLPKQILKCCNWSIG